MEKAKKILKILKGEYLFVLFIVILGIISSYLEVTPTALLGKISNHLTTMVNDGCMKLDNTIITLFIVFAAMIILGSVVRNIFCYYSSKLSNRLIYNVRKQCFSKLMRVNNDYINSVDKGRVVNTIYNSSAKLEMIFSTAMFTLMSDIFDLVMVSVYIALIDVKLLLILISIIPVIYYFGIASGKRQKEFATQRIGLEKRIISSIHQAYETNDIIKIFGGVDKETEYFDADNKAYYQLNNKADRSLSCFFISEKTCRTCSRVLSLIYIASCILTNNINIGSFVTIALYTERFYAPITNITRYFQMIHKGIASIDDIDNFLAQPDAQVNEHMEYKELDGSLIEANDVSVCTNNTIIARNLNMFVRDHCLNIVLGKSGSGKTSFIKMLMGIYGKSQGHVYFDSSLKNVKHVFSYASQNTILFNRTILENCIYPESLEHISEDKLQTAINMLDRLGIEPERVKDNVGENGSSLSGGEIKRIVFVRAVLTKSKILILDEITSNLDYETKSKMEEMIIEESKKRCVIFITHDRDSGVFQTENHMIGIG